MSGERRKADVKTALTTMASILSPGGDLRQVSTLMPEDIAAPSDIARDAEDDADLLSALKHHFRSSRSDVSPHEALRQVEAARLGTGSYLKQNTYAGFSSVGWPSALRVLDCRHPRCTTLKLVSAESSVDSFMRRALSSLNGTVDVPFSLDATERTFQTDAGHIVPIKIDMTETCFGGATGPLVGLAGDLVVIHDDGSEVIFTKTRVGILSSSTSDTGREGFRAFTSHHQVTNVLVTASTPSKEEKKEAALSLVPKPEVSFSFRQDNGQEGHVHSWIISPGSNKNVDGAGLLYSASPSIRDPCSLARFVLATPPKLLFVLDEKKKGETDYVLIPIGETRAGTARHAAAVIATSNWHALSDQPLSSHVHGDHLRVEKSKWLALVRELMRKFGWHKHVMPIGKNSKLVLRLRPVVPGGPAAWQAWYETQQDRRQPESVINPTLTIAVKLKLSHINPCKQDVDELPSDQDESQSESSEDEEAERQRRRQRRREKRKRAHKKTKKESKKETTETSTSESETD